MKVPSDLFYLISFLPACQRAELPLARLSQSRFVMSLAAMKPLGTHQGEIAAFHSQ
jgi:hypothetical protein